MPMVLSGNRMNYRAGSPTFDLHTNLCDYFELGSSSGDDVWLEGQIVQGEFLFNGRLFTAQGHACAILDNFPKAAPEGWTKRQLLDGNGYELVDGRGEVVFGFTVDDNHVCTMTVNLYKEDGSLAAHPGQGGFIVHVPALIGRGGIRFG